MNTQLTSEYIQSNHPGLVSDLAHWADYGITTVEQLGDYLDFECGVNCYKSDNGVRPRHWTCANDAREYLLWRECQQDIEAVHEALQSDWWAEATK